jgi:hypothetical protein
MIKDKDTKMNKDTMIQLIHSELNAEYNDPTIATYALAGLLSALVGKVELEKYIAMKGWNK